MSRCIMIFPHNLLELDKYFTFIKITVFEASCYDHFTIIILFQDYEILKWTPDSRAEIISFINKYDLTQYPVDEQIRSCVWRP